MQEKNKHGFSSVNHPLFYLYSIWVSMKQRCKNPKNKGYHNYGGRGIKMCPEWENNFLSFFHDMGPRPTKFHSIDRINNDGNYCKENCRWATRETQSNNQSYTIFYENNGIRLSETQWARKLGIERNKFMWWVRKEGITWCLENIDKIKKAKRGMSNKEYIEINKINKRREKHGALKKGSNLKITHNVYRGFGERCKKNKMHFWESFESFLKDMGEKPKGKKLKRKDKEKGFYLENCYWG